MGSMHVRRTLRRRAAAARAAATPSLASGRARSRCAEHSVRHEHSVWRWSQSASSSSTTTNTSIIGSRRRPRHAGLDAARRGGPDGAAGRASLL
eukprot:scaffold295195_cov32-Tisochrysis_lutea.AAC.1